MAFPTIQTMIICWLIKKIGGSFFTDVAVKYFCLAEALYYKSLEVIINQEKKRLGDMDLSVGFIFTQITLRTVYALTKPWGMQSYWILAAHFR